MFFWIREAGGKLWRFKKAIESADLRPKVKEIIEKNETTPFALCIHDGVLDGKEICSNMLSTLNTAVSNGVIEKVVHVTSLTFSLSTGGQRLDSSGSILRLSVDSWRLQDYIEAIKCQEFANRMVDSRGSKLSKDKKALGNNRDNDGSEQNNGETGGEEEMVMDADDEMMEILGMVLLRMMCHGLTLLKQSTIMLEVAPDSCSTSSSQN